MDNKQILLGYMSSLSDIVNMNDLVSAAMWNDEVLKEAIDNNDKVFLYAVLINDSLDEVLTRCCITDKMLLSVKNSLKSKVAGPLLERAENMGKALSDNAPMSEKEIELRRIFRTSKDPNVVNEAFRSYERFRKQGVAIIDDVPFLTYSDGCDYYGCNYPDEHYVGVSAKYKELAQRILSVIS